MHRNILVGVLAILLGGAMVVGAQRDTAAPSATERSPRVRIGVYESRAVAVAYARSHFNPVQQKMAEHAAAKQAGDEKKVKELEEWGQQHQRALHFQGFCRVPVTDLLEHVKPGLHKILADQRLVAISMSCDVTSADVELVDVTDQIVDLYEPSAQTRETISQIRKVEPASLSSVAQMSDKD